MEHHQKGDIQPFELYGTEREKTFLCLEQNVWRKVVPIILIFSLYFLVEYFAITLAIDLQLHPALVVVVLTSLGTPSKKKNYVFHDNV